MVAGDQIWRQVKQGPHREHFPALWRALPFVLPPIPPQRSRSFPGLTMRSQVLQSAIFSCIMQTAYRFVGVELRFRHPASRKHGGCHVRGIASFLREGQTRQKPRSCLAPGLLPGILMIAINRLSGLDPGAYATDAPQRRRTPASPRCTWPLRFAPQDV